MIQDLVTEFRILLIGAAILGAAIAVGLVICATVFHVAGRIAGRADTSLGRSIIRHARGPARLIFPLAALFPALPLLGLSAERAQTLHQILSLALTAAIGWLAASATGVMTDLVAERYDIAERDNLRARQIHTQTLVLRRILVSIVVVITACVMLMSFPGARQIGISLFASAGLAGLVIGMAARPALANLIAGLQIAFTDPMRVDDVVIVEGEWGWIEEIRATYVVVRIWDLRRLVVPLSYFLERPFENWTRRTAEILGTVFLHVDYTVPTEEVRAELKRILDGTELWDRKAWGLQVTNTTERTVELRALMSAADSGTAWNLRCHVREALVRYLQENHPNALPHLRTRLAPPALA